MAGEGRRAGGEAERDHRCHFEAVRATVQLLFNAGREVAKARSRSRGSRGVPIIIRGREAQFRTRTNSNPDEGLREIESSLPLAARIEHAVFCLEDAVRNDCAGVCDRGPIGRDCCRCTAGIGCLCFGEVQNDDEQRRPDGRKAPKNCLRWGRR